MLNSKKYEGTDRKADKYRINCQSRFLAHQLAGYLLASEHVHSAMVGTDESGDYVGLYSHLFDDDLLALVRAKYPTITKANLYWFFDGRKEPRK